MLCWIQLAAILRHRNSEVNLLRHWRMHVRAFYICPMVFDVSRFAFVTITIFREDSAKLCLFQQCVSDVNDLAYVTGYVPQDGSALNPR